MSKLTVKPRPVVKKFHTLKELRISNTYTNGIVKVTMLNKGEMKHTYVVNEIYQPTPVAVIALIDLGEGNLYLGYSICAEDDEYSKDVALELAIRRAQLRSKKGLSPVILGKEELLKFPRSVRSDIPEAVSGLIRDSYYSLEG